MATSNSPLNLTRPFGASKFAILLTLHKINVKGNNHYITPSIVSIRKLLNKFHSIDIGERWIYECIKDLCDLGYLRRKRRFKHLQDGSIFSLPGMVTFTLAGIKFLSSKSIIGAREIAAKMISWIKRNDDRWPRAQDLSPQETYLSPAENLLRIKKLIEGFT